MTVREFVQECIIKLDMDAEMDFLLVHPRNDTRIGNSIWLDVDHVCMNADNNNRDRAGIVFVEKKDEL